MNLELLENQAWALLVKLNRIIDSECKVRSKKPISPIRRKKLIHARANAYIRFLRRELKAINTQTNG